MTTGPAAGAPRTEGDGYFLYHSIGQYPGKARDLAAGLAEFSTHWGAANDAQWGHALGLRARFIDRWRALIGAPEGSLTTCENVTAGLYSLVGALPAAALGGKRVLVAGDCFPSLHFLLSGLAPRFGFTLDTVRARPGATWVEDDDVLARWGADVGLALLTWVSSTSSHRADIAGLVAHGRKMGSIIGVDITQAAGLIPFDVTEPAVDFAVSTSLKWMCGTPGAGILQVAPALLRDCRPELRGWFSQADIFSWDIDAFAYAPDIRRFDNGTPAIMACAGTLPALDWHAGQDHAAILAHNRRLAARIIDEATALGYRLASPAAEAARGGSVMLTLGDAGTAQATLAALRAAAVFADARGPVLRLSPGVMTTDAGVTRLLSVLAERRPG